MKRRNGLPICIISVVLFSACATAHYTPLASAERDQVEQLKEHIFRVEYQVSPFTSQDQLDEYLRRRCAELTVREGYDLFHLTQRADVLGLSRRTSMTVTMFKGLCRSERRISLMRGRYWALFHRADLERNELIHSCHWGMDVAFFHRCLIFFPATSHLCSPCRGHHIVLKVVLFVGVCVIGDALAEPTPDPASQDLEHVALRHKGTSKAVEKRLLSEEWGLRFYGYLDGSYTQNFNNPANRINQLRIFDVNSNQFRPNLAQFVFDKEAKEEGSWKDRAGFRMKINAGRDSDFAGGLNLNNWADVQELYLQYVAPIGNGLNVQLGQINTPVGYEVVESPHNPNYSRSWLFGLGQPFTTRGGRVSYEFTKQVSWSVGAISFINSARGNSRHDPLVESALTITPSHRVKLTGYGLAGPRPGATGTTGENVLLAGGFVSIQATEQTSIVVESYYANQANSSTISSSGNARWNGVAAYVMYDLTRQWGFRIRGEVFEDAGGFVSCGRTTDYQPRANVCYGATSTAAAPSVTQTLWEVTSTLQYKPFTSLITRLEYRYDKSNQNVFQVGGRVTSYQPTLSLEAIYLF